MINIDKFKTFLYFIANKNGRGTITPSQFNQTVEQAVAAWTNKQIGDLDQSRPLTSLDLDQLSMEKLRHLKEHRIFRLTNGLLLTPNGTDVLDINSDIAPKYWHFSALSHKIAYNDTEGKLVNYYKEIKIVKDGEFAMRMASNIKMPTFKHPIAVLRAKDFELAPSSINMAKLVYLRTPKTPKWAYDITNGRPVYNQSNSTDLDAPEFAFNDIVMIALENIGIHIRETELVKFATMQENTAQ